MEEDLFLFKTWRKTHKKDVANALRSEKSAVISCNMRPRLLHSDFQEAWIVSKRGINYGFK